jgi:hypothetical protein
LDQRSWTSTVGPAQLDQRTRSAGSGCPRGRVLSFRTYGYPIAVATSATPTQRCGAVSSTRDASTARPRRGGWRPRRAQGAGQEPRRSIAFTQ